MSELESLLFGDLNEMSYNFYYADFKIQSKREIVDEVMRVDFPLLSKLVIGKESFIKGENVVIESMILRKVMK